MYKRAWGKFGPPSNDRVCAEWHPLVDHCAGVAATLEALLKTTLLVERLLLPTGLPVGDERLIQRLAAIAFLHDLGKANRGFQNKIQPAVAEGEPRTAGHVRELWPLLCDQNAGDLRWRLSKALPIETLCAWVEGDAFFPLLVASVSHHGTPWNAHEECRCAHLLACRRGRLRPIRCPDRNRREAASVVPGGLRGRRPLFA